MTVKVLITYDSATGNTEAMAHEVAEGAKMAGAEVVLKRASEASLEDLEAADAIIVGSPTYYGLMSAKVKELFDRSEAIHEKLEGKVGAAFTSAGGTATGAETTLLSIIQAFLIHGMVVQGRPDSKHYGAAAVGKPDEKEQKLCRELGERTVCLAGRLKGA